MSLMPFIAPAKIITSGIGSVVCRLRTGASDQVYTNTSLPAIGTGDFTLECWIKPISLTRNFHGIMSFNAYNSGGTLYVKSTGELQAYVGGVNKGKASAGVTTGAWQHVALVRSGGNLEIYKDGVALSYGATSTENVPAGPARLAYSTFGKEYFDGNLALARWSDTARYTSNFTPSNGYLSDANTLALIGSFDGGSTISDYTGLLLTEAGSPTASSDAP